MTEPTVAQFMTEEPATADEGLSLADAYQRMFLDKIRHLVVLRNGHAVGIVSARDVAVAAAVGVDKSSKLKISDAMSKHPYTVAPTTPISEVAHTMEAHRWGAALIVDGEEVIGVFTTTDALRALRQLATGKPAEAAVPAEHLPPAEPDHVRPFRVRRHRPIDGGSTRLFTTQPK